MSRLRVAANVLAAFFAVAGALACSCTADGRRSERADAEVAAAAIEQPNDLEHALLGRVVDTNGTPLSGLELVLVPSGALPPDGPLTPPTTSRRTGDGMQRALRRAPPIVPSARHTTSGADGAFHFGALDEHETYELFVEPTSHTVLTFPNGGVCSVGDHVELVAHELVDVNLEFTPVEGAPTQGLLVQTILSMRVAKDVSGWPFGEDLVVDAPRATLRLVRGIHSLEVTSWSGSNEETGIGGSTWFWKGACEAGASDRPTVVELAPRRSVDVTVHLGPLPQGHGKLVLAVAREGSAPDDPSVHRQPIDDRMRTSVTIEGGAGRHVARLLTPSGRVLVERAIDLDRPRVAVQFDLAELVATPVFVTLDLPRGFALDGTTVTSHLGHALPEKLQYTVEPDGRLRFESIALCETVQEPLTASAPPALDIHHPRLGSVYVELQSRQFEYHVAYPPVSAVRVNFVGEGAENIVSTCDVMAERIDALDGRVQRHHWYPSNEFHRLTRDVATKTLGIEGLDPGAWRISIGVAPDSELSRAQMPRRVLGVFDVPFGGGEHVFDLHLAARHGVALWFPSVKSRRRSALIIGEGLRVEDVTDDFGSLRLDGLFAGRYVVAINDYGFEGRRFDLTVPCGEVIWTGRPHDALQVTIARDDSPLATAGLVDGDLVIGFDGHTFREQKDWHDVVPSDWFDDAGFGSDDGAREDLRHDAPHTALEVWGLTAERSVNLRVQRGEAVIDLAVGPIAAHTPEELEALGGTLTPVYRE